MPDGDPKVARYVSPGTGPESGQQSHAYRDTGRTDATTGAAVLAPEVRDLVAQTKLEELKTRLDSLIGGTDQLEGFTDGLESLLTDLKTFTDGIEGLLTTIRDNADGVESALTTLNGKDFATGAKQDAAKTVIDALLVELGQKTEPADTQQTNTKQINGTAPNMGTGAAGAGTQRVVLANDQPTVPVSQASQPLPSGASTEATLAQVRDHLDTVEAKLQSLIDNTDTLEINTDGVEGLLTTIRDNADAVETKQDTGNTTLASILAAVDQLEGYLDTVESLLTGAAVTDANNTTTSVLTAGSTYTGTATDITNYAQVNISIFGRPGVVAGDGSSAKGSFYFEFSKDGTNWDTSVPHLIRDPSLVIPIPVIHVHRYFRVKYINDGGTSAIAALGLADTAGTPTTQTTFRLTSYLYPRATKELTRTLDQGISGSDPAALTRSALLGKQPDGTWVNQRVSGSDAGNSRTANLAGGATFTGTWKDTSGFVGLMVMIAASHISAAEGVKVQFSENQSTVHREITFSYEDTTTGQPILLPIVQGEYYRVVYVNGAVTTTSLLIRSEMLSFAAQVPLAGISGLGITDRSLAAMGRSINTAKNALGTYGNIERGTNGGLDIGLVQHEVETPIKALSSLNIQRQTITTTAALVPATPLTNRKTVSFKADLDNGNNRIHIGHNSSVTTSTGYELGSGDSIEMDIDATVSVYAIASTGSQSLYICETAGTV